MSAQNYEKKRRIGEGAFGKAWLVQCKTGGTNLVIKEVNMSQMTFKQKEDARKEVSLLANMNHRNIVKYIESFEECGTLNIVMEYCDAGDLFNRINQQKGALFPEELVLDWFVQICLGIKHIHDRKILHRDIKSQNIFLTSRNQVKLGDFGIAKVLNSTTDLARTAIGTPYYLSPEICENTPYNNKSDIWSLGCVLYEITTLKHAFEAGNMKNLVLKIIRGVYPPISPKYSYELRNLIAQMLKRTPRERPKINAILKKPLVSSRIEKFLSESEIKDEFAHTVMHGQRMVHRPGPLKRPSNSPALAGKRPGSSESSRPFTPGRVLGQPGVKKPRNGNVRPPSASSAVKDPRMANRRAELERREKRRQEEAKKKQEEALQQHLKDKAEKQRLEAINKSREDNWREIRISAEGRQPAWEKPKSPSPVPKPEVKREPLVVQTPPPAGGAAAPGGPGGNYAHYYADLERLERLRNAPEREVNYLANREKYMDAPVVASPVVPPAVGRPDSANQARRAANEGATAGAMGADAAEQARVLQEYLERKREAARNRARGQAGIRGVLGEGIAGSPRVEQEKEYMSRLNQIRERNLHDRKGFGDYPAEAFNAQNAAAGIMDEHELRRKKIEALKKQAEDRAKELKGRLDQRLQQGYEREQAKIGQWKKEHQPPAGPAKQTEEPKNSNILFPKREPVQPVAPAAGDAAKGPSITLVMQKLQEAQRDSENSPSPYATPSSSAHEPPSSVTAAMSKLHEVQQSGEDRLGVDRSTVKKQKKQNILRRLNARSIEDRGKWAAIANESEAAHPPGGPVEGGKLPPSLMNQLANRPLEETGSGMDVTYLMGPPGRIEEEEKGPRQQWGAPRQTLLNILQKVELADQTFGSGSTGSGGDEDAPSQPPALKRDGTFTKDDSGPGAPHVAWENVVLEDPKPDEPGLTPGTTQSLGAPSGDLPLPHAPLAAVPPALSMIKESTESSVIKESTESTVIKESTESTVIKESTESSVIKESADSAMIKELAESSVVTIATKDNLDSQSCLPHKPSAQERISDKNISPRDGAAEEKKGSAGRLFEKVEFLEETENKKKDGDSIQVEDVETPKGTSVTPVTTGTAFAEDIPLKHSTVVVVEEEDVAEEEDSSSDIDDDDDLDQYRKQLQDVLRGSTDEKEKNKASNDVIDAPLLRENSQSKLERDAKTDVDKRRTIMVTAVFKDGLSSGRFDQHNATLLRTCSLPDLTSLFREVDDDISIKIQSKSRGSENAKSMENVSTPDDEVDHVEDEDEDDDGDNEDDDDELEQLRDSMQQLLDQSDVDSSTGSANTTGTLTVVSSVSSKRVRSDSAEGASGDADGEEEGWDEEDDDDDDDDEDFGDEEFGNQHLFLDLERLREDLEKELGMELLMKVYKMIQTFQEDEDDSVNECEAKVVPILGAEKAHFYPRILNLVLADGAFLDND